VGLDVPEVTLRRGYEEGSRKLVVGCFLSLWGPAPALAWPSSIRPPVACSACSYPAGPYRRTPPRQQSMGQFSIDTPYFKITDNL
jgi:hypothetical protein